MYRAFLFSSAWARFGVRVRALSASPELFLSSAPIGTCAGEMGRSWLLYLRTSDRNPTAIPDELLLDWASTSPRVCGGIAFHPDPPDLGSTPFRLDHWPIQGVAMISAAFLQGGGLVASELMRPFGLAD